VAENRTCAACDATASETAIFFAVKEGRDRDRKRMGALLFPHIEGRFFAVPQATAPSPHLVTRRCGGPCLRSCGRGYRSPPHASAAPRPRVDPTGCRIRSVVYRLVLAAGRADIPAATSRFVPLALSPSVSSESAYDPIESDHEGSPPRHGSKPTKRHRTRGGGTLRHRR
jgi:hypothetical protein